jgi:predicted RNA-binding protein
MQVTKKLQKVDKLLAQVAKRRQKKRRSGTIQRIYKAIPENLEDCFSEYHDLIMKREN